MLLVINFQTRTFYYCNIGLSVRTPKPTENDAGGKREIKEELCTVSLYIFIVKWGTGDHKTSLSQLPIFLLLELHDCLGLGFLYFITSVLLSSCPKVSSFSSSSLLTRVLFETPFSLLWGLP